MSTLKELYRKKGGKQNADQPFSAVFVLDDEQRKEFSESELHASDLPGSEAKYCCYNYLPNANNIVFLSLVGLCSSLLHKKLNSHRSHTNNK